MPPRRGAAAAHELPGLRRTVYLIIGQYSVISAMEGRLADTLNVSLGRLSHNTRIKLYPDGSMDVLVCEKPIFGTAGWEAQHKGRRIRDLSIGAADGPDRAMRRARAQVRELALANTALSLFVTLTLDSRRVDRYDMVEITRKLNAWLDNSVRRRGLAYVLVPERHKDGAIHFHGLFNRALALADSGYTDSGGHVIFNLPQWSLGFTTAIELYGEREAAVGYVTKYIGKQGEKPGGRWYYSGGDLRRPEVTYCDIPLRDAMEQPGAYCFTVGAARAAFCQFRLRGGVDGAKKAIQGAAGAAAAGVSATVSDLSQ